MEHTLAKTVTNGRTVASWTCSCGASGKTTRAFAGEILEEKAKRNHAQHARKAAGKVAR